MNTGIDKEGLAKQSLDDWLGLGGWGPRCTTHLITAQEASALIPDADLG